MGVLDGLRTKILRRYKPKVILCLILKMDYINVIKSLDTGLFLFLNSLHNSFFDGFMYTFSQTYVWGPFYASVIYVLIKVAKKDAIWLILALILCVVLADRVSSGIIKDLVQRLRPTRNPSLEGLVHIVNGYAGGKYGFVSSHAANTFGFAMLSSLLLRERVYVALVFLWAIVTSYSRIYLGVHYPLDILGGILVGFSAALFCFWLIKKFRKTALDHQFTQERAPIFVLGLSVLSISIYSLVSYVINN